MSKILNQLVGAGVLSERIYGRATEDDEKEDVTPVSAAKIDPSAPQATPGSQAAKEAEAAATPATGDDAALAAENGLDADAPAAPSAVTVDAPVTFLLMTLMSARGMVDAVEQMAPDLSARFGEQSIPVLNDVIFKVRSAHEMLQGLVEASHEADGVGDDKTADGEKPADGASAPAAQAAPGAKAEPAPAPAAPAAK